MLVRFLGTGTSQGVPVIGCECEVCTSEDFRDNRLRTSMLVRFGQVNLVIDAGPDFRQQMLRAKIASLDAILLTHQHNDHLIGLDEIRPFNFRQMNNMPVFAAEAVQEEIKRRFHYIFEENPYPGAPMIEFRTISKEQDFSIGGLHIRPVEVMHGELPILGFRFGDFTYLTDVKTISTEEMRKIYGSKVLVLNALHYNPHHSHLNVEEALALIRQLAPQQAYLTHMSHRIGLHAEASKQLPPGVFLAYDGLELIM